MEKISMTFQMPVELHEQLRRAAFEMKVSQAEIIRLALERFLKKE